MNESRQTVETDTLWLSKNIRALNFRKPGHLRKYCNNENFQIYGNSTRACFIKKLQELLEDEYEDFESLDKVEKSSYVLGSELWESKFDGLLSLVKEYIIDVWEIRKHKLYDSDSGPGQQLHSRSSPGERNGKFCQNGKFGQKGKLGHSCTNVTKGKLYGSQDSDHAIVHLGLIVSSSAHNCGCVVDGGNTMAAI